MTIQEELKDIFKRFGLTVAQVQARLSEVGMADYSQCLTNPPEKAWAEKTYFAIASLVLEDAESILEIGTSRGATANVLSKLFPNSTVYTIDIGPKDPLWKYTWRSGHPDRVAIFNENLSRGNIKFIESNSFFLPGLELPEKFSFIYVDGDHLYPVVAADISFAYNHLRKGGFLFMHDYEVKRVELDVSNAVNWMRERIEEEVLEFPMVISNSNKKPNKKMACLVKE